MSYASQQAFEGLGELVEDLMERLEAAEAKAEEQEAAWETKLEEQRVALEARVEADIGRMNGVLAEERAANAEALARLEQVVEQRRDGNMFLRLNMKNGEGGTAGKTVYTTDSGIVVTSSTPVYNNSNYYYIRYLFREGRESGSYTDHFLAANNNPCSLTIEFPSPLPVAGVRVLASSGDGHRNKCGCDYDLAVLEEGRNGYSSVVTGVTCTPFTWTAHPFPDAPALVSAIRFTMRLPVGYGHVGCTSIEVYIDPRAALELDEASSALLAGSEYVAAPDLVAPSAGPSSRT